MSRSEHMFYVEMLLSANTLLLNLMRSGKLGGKTGFYLRIADIHNAFPRAIVQIGEVLREKEGKYFDLTGEKARRLLTHPSHYTSWDSRDPENFQYGGAVRGLNYIISVSGLSEEADEAVSAYIAKDFGGYSDEVVFGSRKNELYLTL